MRQYIFVLCFALLAVACGGSTGPEAETSPTPTPEELLALDSGDFVAVTTGVENGCDIEPRTFKDGFEAAVEVNGIHVEIADMRFIRNKNALVGPEERTIHDYRLTRGKDCVVNESLIWDAQLTADNHFDMWLTWDFAATGEECTPEVAGLTVPCVSVATASFEPL